MIRRFLLGIGVVSLFILCSCNKCKDKNCSDYSTQAEAQAAFESDRECYGDLDHDNDGIACESNAGYSPSSTSSTSQNTTPSTSSPCPTTAKCGCSGYNKADCPTDPCCKWTSGAGCGCK